MFGTRSIATNLVTPLEFQPIRCAIMLCLFGQTRNGYVSTYIFPLSSTSASSATSDYVVVAKHFGQNEKPAGSKEERNRKKPRFVSKVDLIEAIVFPSMGLLFSVILLAHFIYFWCIFSYFPSVENLFDRLFLLIFNVSARK